MCAMSRRRPSRPRRPSRRPVMRLRLALLLIVVPLVLAPSRAHALCPSWRVGPFWLDFASQGTNGSVADKSIVWDPDGAGPLPARLVVSGNFNRVQGTLTGGIAQYDP